MVTRYQHEVPSGPEANGGLPHTVPDLARVYDGPVHFPGFDGEPIQRGTARHVVSFAGTPGGSVIATRQNIGGRDTVELEPGNPSSRTLLTLAVQQGLVEQHLPGQYRDVQREAPGPSNSPEGQSANEDAQEGPQEAAGAFFDTEDDALWSEDIAPLPQHAYDAAVASVVGVISTGMGSMEDTAKALARNAAIAPALALEYVTEGTAMYERTVARAVAPMGLQGDRLQEFYDWAREQRGLQDAIQRLVHQRDAGGFRQLAVTFKRTSPGDLSAYTNAGFETHVDAQTGDLMVRREGGTWRRAADL